MGKIKREDKIVIKALRVEKNWSCRRFLKKFASMQSLVQIKP